MTGGFIQEAMAASVLRRRQGNGGEERRGGRGGREECLSSISTGTKRRTAEQGSPRGQLALRRVRANVAAPRSTGHDETLLIFISLTTHII